MSPHPDFKPFPSARGGTFELRGQVDLRAEVDLPALIRAHLDEYANANMAGCEEWERPMVFLIEYADELNDLCISDGRYLYESPWSNGIEWDTMQWTYTDYDRLIEMCPEADLTRPVPEPAHDPDPNQPTLPEENA